MEHVGRFRIEARIGEGAMGVVYLATDPRLDRKVAVKVYRLPEGLPAERVAEFRERFLREARAAGALSHPGIVTVYDADEDPESRVPFIAMEHVRGESLRELLAREGTLVPDRVVAIVSALADALDAAHAAGIVHRDVKPANVLVREADGAVKIADFGVARLGTSTLTGTGNAIGSPAYMSPEQVRGDDVDGRSDLFSLAVIAYEMLCGRRPFSGEQAAELLYAVVHRPAEPPTRVRPELPPDLDTFFITALAKSREARCADGATLARDLARALRPPATGERTVVDGAAPDGFAGVGRSASPTAVPGIGAATAAGVVRGRGVRTPRARRTIAAAVAAAVLTGGGWIAYGRMTTWLEIDGTSAMTSGRLTLYVDGEEVWERELAAPEDQQGLLKRVVRRNTESFETRIRVAPGIHEVAAHVAAPDGGADLRSTVVVEFPRGDTRTLKLSAGRMFGQPLSIREK